MMVAGQQTWSYPVTESETIDARDRRYYMGAMFRVIPAGRYIIIQSPGSPELLERVWHRDELITGLWDGFFEEDTILYNNMEGALVRVDGKMGEHQFIQPIVPENLEGRAKRLYEYWSKTLVEISRI